MRNGQRGASVQVVLGIILVILGIVAIAIAPQIMNEAEIGTLRKVGGGIAGLGVLVVIAAVAKNKA
ncbi:MAG: hypothetical protein JO257_25045 [Deltaproteobacteria bacterium]|nr:hypothetical protein [Deltaproteobacteria bacterium]